MKDEMVRVEGSLKLVVYVVFTLIFVLGLLVGLLF